MHYIKKSAKTQVDFFCQKDWYNINKVEKK